LSGQREFEAGHHRRPFSCDRVLGNYGQSAQMKIIRLLYYLMN